MRMFALSALLLGGMSLANVYDLHGGNVRNDTAKHSKGNQRKRRKMARQNPHVAKWRK